MGKYKDISVWENLEQRCQKEVAFTHPLAQDHKRMIEIIYTAFSKLKSTHAEYIVDVVMLYMPRNQVVGPLGRSVLRPAGLDHPAISNFQPQDLDDLLADMSTSTTITQLRADNEERKKDEEERKKEAAAEEAKSKTESAGSKDKKAGKKQGRQGKKGSGKGSKSQKNGMAEEIPETDVSGKRFLAHWNDTKHYLLKIDNKNEQILDSFTSLVFVGVVTGSVGVHQPNREDLKPSNPLPRSASS